MIYRQLQLTLNNKIAPKIPIPIKHNFVFDAGGIRSANADMSNDKGGEKPPRQKSRFPTPINVA